MTTAAAILAFRPGGLTIVPTCISAAWRNLGQPTTIKQDWYNKIVTTKDAGVTAINRDSADRNAGRAGRPPEKGNTPHN